MSNSHIIKVNPKTETPPQTVRGRNISYRYAFARSADSQAEDDLGQDYLLFQEKEDAFLFVLCDGVSQSFFGNVAARILGDSLLAWLEEIPAASSPDKISASLSALLGDLTRRGSAAVQEQAIPRDVPPMLQEVLEEKRALGSEATFVCGRIDLPSKSLPRGRALLAWMGDSRLRFWGAEGERTPELRDTFHTEERWSTKRGLVNGAPHIHLILLNDSRGKRAVQRLMAYSDGLASLDRADMPVSNHRLNDMIRKTGHSPTSDDVSFLEVWLGKLPGIVDRKPEKKVSGVDLQKQDQQKITLRWQAVLGISAYEIIIRNQNVQYFQTKDTQWTSETLPPGKNGFWVRGIWPDGEMTLMSDPVGVEVPAPQPDEMPLREPPLPPVGKPESAPKRLWPLAGIIAGGLIGVFSLGLLGYFVFFGKRGQATPTQTLETSLTEAARVEITHEPTPPPSTPTPAPTITPDYTPTSKPTSPPTLLPEPTTQPIQVDGMTLVYIPAGEFKMGIQNGQSGDNPVHTVYVDAFWIDQHEVTYGQYMRFVEATDATAFVSGEGENHPVTDVAWEDARAYCEWAGRRLPTEAEWEKAARGGLEGKKYPWGDKRPVCKPGERNGAQFKKCGDSITVPVKTFTPNEFGLYDMAGNVREWVADWYDNEYYNSSPLENPNGPASGTERVVRGGSWNDSFPLLSLTSRLQVDPEHKNTHIGFRCAMDAVFSDEGSPDGSSPDAGSPDDGATGEGVPGEGTP